MAMDLASTLQASARPSRRFLERGARRAIKEFILGRQGPRGGFRGRDAKDDLYYTVFAVAALRALGHRPPVRGLWNYARAFGGGDGLDRVHLVCLILLRSAFPMSSATRSGLTRALEGQPVASAYDRFLERMAREALGLPRHGATLPTVAPQAPTPHLAADLVLRGPVANTAAERLLGRAAAAGGFRATPEAPAPDLLSTAVALFALHGSGANLDACRQANLAYVASLWRDDGGFAACAADGGSDVEYTFHALLAIGCLMA